VVKFIYPIYELTDSANPAATFTQPIVLRGLIPAGPDADHEMGYQWIAWCIRAHGENGHNE
jgi:hypothetical protein